MNYWTDVPTGPTRSNAEREFTVEGAEALASILRCLLSHLRVLGVLRGEFSPTQPLTFLRIPFVLSAACCLATAVFADEVHLGLRVPDGFEVTEFADHTLANDIYAMTLDPKGRVVVSGRGYVRILVDDDGDGRADRAVAFADGPADGAMGMLWEGPSLFVTGDGGLRRYRDDDGDDRADGPAELIRKIATGGEHSSHAIRRGPDGWMYVICGNFTGIGPGFAQLPTSPVREPVAGCVLRFTPDLESSEIVADGFRNAYDMDFNLDGELFTYDSDNERCVSLPWYEPTRFYHVIPGGHYGWRAPQRAGFWRFPPYFFDCVAPVAYLNRGSPTGVECYRHTAFPAKYHGGMFALDWTFGRIYFLPLERAGSTYASAPELFAESVGDNGFAPTDVVVHPDTGDLYVSVGGRGTRGAVYRIRYGASSSGVAGAKRSVPRGPDTEAGMARLEWDAGDRTALLQRAAGDDALERLRALNLILRHRQRFDDDAIAQAIRANWDHRDRYVRHATAKLIASQSATGRRSLKAEATTTRPSLTYGWGIVGVAPQAAVESVVGLIADRETDVDLRLDGVRLLQVALGDIGSPSGQGTVWEGYSLRAEAVGQAVPDAQRPQSGRSVRHSRGDENVRHSLTYETTERAAAAVRAAFPSGNADLDRELSRTLALIEDDSPLSLGRVVERLTEESHPVDDVHYLIVLSRLRSPRSEAATSAVARALLALDRKIRREGLNRDTHWPLRVGELVRELARKDPNLNSALLAAEEFGRPDHVLFTGDEGFDRQMAAAVFFRRAVDDEDFAWGPELVELIGALNNPQADDLLRSRWHDVGLRDAILRVLARRPALEDRGRFLEGLSSAQLDTVGRSLAALGQLPPASGGEDVLSLVQALGRLRGDTKQEEQLRQGLSRYLERVAGNSPGAAGGAPVPPVEVWRAWFAESYPELARRLESRDGIDLAAWTERLAGIDWSRGDTERGAEVFVTASCAACHSSARALGPDLRGVAVRFSREDLFTAILQPNRDVSSQYQTIQIVTTTGRTYQGAIIYEAVDGVILQIGAAETVRIPGGEIESTANVPTSLMPAGLLDPLSDEELADLHAYLRDLRK